MFNSYDFIFLGGHEGVVHQQIFVFYFQLFLLLLSDSLTLQVQEAIIPLFPFTREGTIVSSKLLF